MMRMQRVYIGMGSNMGKPDERLIRAAEALSELPRCRYISDSGLYLSKAMLASESQATQADYYNAVVLLETQLQPLELLDFLQAIELRHGRVRDEHWGPRTLDLDILLFGDLQIDSERLQIPHPGLCEREFVLYPLQRIEAEMDIPGHGKLSDCILKCARNGLRYMGSIEDISREINAETSGVLR